jgi:hypothetical protein
MDSTDHIINMASLFQNLNLKKKIYWGVVEELKLMLNIILDVNCIKISQNTLQLAVIESATSAI